MESNLDNPYEPSVPLDPYGEPDAFAQPGPYDKPVDSQPMQQDAYGQPISISSRHRIIRIRTSLIHISSRHRISRIRISLIHISRHHFNRHISRLHMVSRCNHNISRCLISRCLISRCVTQKE